jgi:hypothetical protein
MASKCYTSAGRKDPKLMSEAEWDEELAKINARMDELALEMQQNTRSIWVYEWPMGKLKVKWPVKQLMVIRQCRLLRRWFRHAENLNGLEEGAHICELETVRNLSDDKDEMGVAEDLKKYQEGREEIPNCQVGKELISLRGLIDCHEKNQGISHC